MRPGPRRPEGSAQSNPRAAARDELERALDWRSGVGVLASGDACRVFHGPGEGSGALREVTIDRFGEYAWVTARGDPGGPALELVGGFLKDRGFRGACAVLREGAGSVAKRILFGEMPVLVASEGEARYEIRFAEPRHPGLFLDQAPLRTWLRARARGWRVANLFSYTGSLGLAAALGGAAQVVSVDISAPALDWARVNWRLSSRPGGRFERSDALAFLKLAAKREERFDCIIADPPSFATTKKGGAFSVRDDLAELARLAAGALSPGGWMVLSTNSESISRDAFEREISTAAGPLVLHSRIELPETFPTRLDRPGDRYLKGIVARRAS